MGEREAGVLRLDFDRRLKLEFHGSSVTSDAGLLPYRELDDVLGLTNMAGDVLTDTRRGKNGRHSIVGQFRQSVFGRLGGYDGLAEGGRALVIDDAAGEIGEDRCQGCQPRPVRHVPTGRGCCAEGTVPENPEPD